MNPYRQGNRPWAKLTEEDLHRELAKLGIYPRLIEQDGKIGWGYEWAQFADAWRRHLPDRGVS